MHALKEDDMVTQGLLLADGEELVEIDRGRRPNSKRIWLLHMILLASSGTLFVLAALQYGTGYQHCTTDYQSTPALEISKTYHKVRFDGSLRRGSSPYKGPPSPQVDAAWARIIEVGAMSVSEEVYQTVNASKHAVRMPKELGGGRQALLETIHQLHCLRDLWRLAYPDYYTAHRTFSQEHPEEFLEHIDHCADILRQKLMCDADEGVITYNWVKGHWMPHPNFHVQHTCRDFEAVLQYAREHQVHNDRSYLLRPAGGDWVDFEDEPPFDPDAGG